jgi:hypothetical protein
VDWFLICGVHDLNGSVVVGFFEEDSDFLIRSRLGVLDRFFNGFLLETETFRMLLLCNTPIQVISSGRLSFRVGRWRRTVGGDQRSRWCGGTARIPEG